MRHPIPYCIRKCFNGLYSIIALVFKLFLTVICVCFSTILTFNDMILQGELYKILIHKGNFNYYGWDTTSVK